MLFFIHQVYLLINYLFIFFISLVTNVMNWDTFSFLSYIEIGFIINFRLSWMFSPTFSNMKALVVMCLIFVSCFADDNPTTVHKNVEDDDGGHDNGQHKPDNLKMQSYAGGYEGFGEDLMDLVDMVDMVDRDNWGWIQKCMKSAMIFKEMLALRFEVWINSAVAGIGDIIWGSVICKFQDLMNISFWF